MDESTVRLSVDITSDIAEGIVFLLDTGVGIMDTAVESSNVLEALP